MVIFHWQGQPLIFHAVNSLARFQEVEKIILVVDDTEKVARLIATCPAFPKHKVTICRGDASRHRSIKAGIDLISQGIVNLLSTSQSQKIATSGDGIYFPEAEADVPDLVMIHDGARPLMPSKDLTNDLFKAAESHGAAGFYLPLVSTLLEIDPLNGDVKDCVKRAKYVASETPQAFTWNVIRDAYLKVGFCETWLLSL